MSILGLVLVRQPYYNEAGYEALVGTEASKVPAIMYSERAYLRSKGFMITALTALLDQSQQHIAPGADVMEDVLRWVYFSSSGPRLLDSAIRDIDGILENSDGVRDLDGLTVMSKGACIPLRRVMDKLKRLQQSGSLTQPA